MEEAKKHTCLKLHIPNTNNSDTEPIFVKGTWFQTHFELAITDGLNAWLCNASEEEVKQRAAQWDQPVSEYVQLAELYLGFQQPGSVYGFDDSGDGHKRLSWTFEKEGTTLQWRWKCQQSSNCKKTTAEILDFLMDANIRLSVNYGVEDYIQSSSGTQMSTRDMSIQAAGGRKKGRIYGPESQASAYTAESCSGIASSQVQAAKLDRIQSELKDRIY